MSGKGREMLCMGRKNQSNKINSAYFSNNVYAKSLQAGTTLCVANQAPLSMGILQARILEWVAVFLLQGLS